MAAYAVPNAGYSTMQHAGHATAPMVQAMQEDPAGVDKSQSSRIPPRHSDRKYDVGNNMIKVVRKLGVKSKHSARLAPDLRIILGSKLPKLQVTDQMTRHFVNCLNVVRAELTDNSALRDVVRGSYSDDFREALHYIVWSEEGLRNIGNMARDAGLLQNEHAADEPARSKKSVAQLEEEVQRLRADLERERALRLGAEERIVEMKYAPQLHEVQATHGPDARAMLDAALKEEVRARLAVEARLAEETEARRQAEALLEPLRALTPAAPGASSASGGDDAAVHATATPIAAAAAMGPAAAASTAGGAANGAASGPSPEGLLRLLGAAAAAAAPSAAQPPPRSHDQMMASAFGAATGGAPYGLDASLPFNPTGLQSPAATGDGILPAWASLPMSNGQGLVAADGARPVLLPLSVPGGSRGV